MVLAAQSDTLSPRPYETDPFRTSASISTDLNWDSATYIYEHVVILSSMCYVLKFEHAYVLKLI